MAVQPADIKLYKAGAAGLGGSPGPLIPCGTLHNLFDTAGQTVATTSRTDYCCFHVVNGASGGGDITAYEARLYLAAAFAAASVAPDLGDGRLGHQPPPAG